LTLPAVNATGYSGRVRCGWAVARSVLPLRPIGPVDKGHSLLLGPLIRRNRLIRARTVAARERCPSAERAAADWLRQQLRTYRDEANRLRTENQELRDQLARHLGAARATAAATGTPAVVTLSQDRAARSGDRGAASLPGVT